MKYYYSTADITTTGTANSLTAILKSTPVVLVTVVCDMYSVLKYNKLKEYIVIISILVLVLNIML